MCPIALIYKLTVYLPSKYPVFSHNERVSCINWTEASLWVSFSRHQYPNTTWPCPSLARVPFARLNGTRGTICKRQLLYMYLMLSRKSSNFRTIIAMEIIPPESDVINFGNILFVYSEPLTRKRFSVVNFGNKWCEKRRRFFGARSNFLMNCAAVNRQNCSFVTPLKAFKE